MPNRLFHYKKTQIRDKHQRAFSVMASLQQKPYRVNDWLNDKEITLD